MNSNFTNPALKDIQFLVGRWNIEISNASFLPDPGQKVRFSAQYEWKADGSVIAMQQKNDEIKEAPGSATWIIGRDESDDRYAVLYADSRGESRIYLMSFAHNIWRMWRDNPIFSQRFEGRVSEDRNMIKARWECSSDSGKTWEHDFDMFYSRA